MAKPKVGDAAFAHSREMKITELRGTVAVLASVATEEIGEERTKTVPVETIKVQAGDLIWLEDDKAWTLPGHMLSAEHREAWRKLTGSKRGPNTEQQVSARDFLRFKGVEV